MGKNRYSRTLRANSLSGEDKPGEMSAFDMCPKIRAEYRRIANEGGDSFQQKRVFTQLDVNILEGEENE